MKITELEPKLVWQYFDEITRVPRPSKHEEQIVAYLVAFAEKHNLEYKKDECGNVVIFKPATAGMEHRKPIVLQSHVDMVCEKNNDKVHNFATDPITTIVDGDWVRADGTTLGADDGIGVAAELALLAADNIKHGPIECLFTIDEETGLTGAENLKSGFMTGKTLLNLDSEDEGEIYIGCAGGCSTIAEFAVEEEPAPEGMIGITVQVSGLLGGHSGGDIHLGRGNANKILARFVKKAADELGFRISAISGGNLHNAISREAQVTGVVPFKLKEDVRVLFNVFAAEVQDELHTTDPGVTLTLQTTDVPKALLTADLQKRLLLALVACPHGVIEMSHDIPDLVETSTNLASISRTSDAIRICTSQRSSVESAKVYVQQMVASAFGLAGAKVTCGEGYPGWKPDMNSNILAVASASYERLFGKKPLVKAIHAGLECGLFLEKYPELDMISFGPTLRGVHSPDERIEICTVDMFWRFLVDIVEHFE